MMATTEQPVYEGSRIFLNLKVYPNRIEVAERVAFFLPKHLTTIPMRNVAEVEVRGNGKTLRVSTNDGKRHDYVGIGAGKARDAIVALL